MYEGREKLIDQPGGGSGVLILATRKPECTTGTHLCSLLTFAIQSVTPPLNISNQPPHLLPPHPPLPHIPPHPLPPLRQQTRQQVLTHRRPLPRPVHTDPPKPNPLLHPLPSIIIPPLLLPPPPRHRKRKPRARTMPRPHPHYVEPPHRLYRRRCLPVALPSRRGGGDGGRNEVELRLPLPPRLSFLPWRLVAGPVRKTIIQNNPRNKPSVEQVQRGEHERREEDVQGDDEVAVGGGGEGEGVGGT